MATEVVTIVDPNDSGAPYTADYSSLAAWEAGEQGDLVSADEIAVADCRSYNGDADTSYCDVNGWTTDATRYVKIWTDPAQGYRHDGKWNTSAYRIEISGSVFRDTSVHAHIDGIQFSQSNTGTYNALHFESIASTPCYLSNCIIRCSVTPTGTQNAVRVGSSAATFHMWNNLIYGFSSTGRAFRDESSSGVYGYFYNNTIINCGVGLYVGSQGTVVAVNNLVNGCSSSYTGTFSSSSGYNSTDTSDTIAGSNNRTSQTFSFVNAASDDYHLASDDGGAIGYGIGPSSDANVPTSDIDGDTRSGSTTDIGMDLYEAAGTTKTVTDSGAGADSLSQLGVTLALADAGAGADSFSGQAALALSDAGAGFDSTAAYILIQISDTGACEDLVPVIQAALEIPESGSAVDILSQISAALLLSDTGDAIDSIFVIQGENIKTIIDAGSGLETISGVGVQVTLSDAGTAIDLISQVLASFSVSDTGAGADIALAIASLAKGRVRVTFSAKTPSFSINAKAPSFSITGKTPKITIH